MVMIACRPSLEVRAVFFVIFHFLFRGRIAFELSYRRAKAVAHDNVMVEERHNNGRIGVAQYTCTVRVLMREIREAFGGGRRPVLRNAQ